MRFWGLVIVILGLVLITPRAKAQIMTLPIPGSPLSLNIQANPQPLQNLNTNPSATAHNLYDDGWVNVPLQFGFSFYGQTFDMSTMYSNGAVQFGRPVAEGGWPYWNNAFCCSGIRLNSQTPEGYYYSILPLQTDLAGWYGNQHYTLGNGNSMTYGWYNVEQFGYSGNRSSFELKIDKTGAIDMRWSGALVSYTPVTIGTVGNASLGQYTENYYGSGINIGPTQLTTGVIDLCVTNPLSSPTCTGYTEAYKTQQCAISALYDPSCPGYQEAYFSQQCTINPLYNSACPGYAEAYQTYLANQACTANPQSSPTCSGYVAPVATTTTTTATTTTTTTTPQLVSDPVVNQTITTTSTSTAPTAPSAPVQLTTTSTQQTTTALVVESVQTQSTTSSSTSTTTSSTSTTSTTSAPTARQSIQQARVEAARRQAVEKGNEAVKESGEARSMDQQRATQSLVIAAMGFNPGFDAYNSVVMRDVPFYRPFTIYGGQRTVDNRAASRGLFGATDQLHNQMVDQQYKLGQ